MASARKVIVGSRREAPMPAPSGAPDLQARAEVSVYLKRSAAQARISRADLRARREAEMQPGVDQVTAFAKAHHLEVVERHAGRGLVKLAGTIQALEAAFGTQLQLYLGPQGSFRARSGELTAPAEMADVVERCWASTSGRWPRPSRSGSPILRRMRASCPTP